MEVHRFPRWKHLSSRRTVPTGEHQRRKEPGMVQLSGVHRHADIVAAQSDRHVTRPHLVVHAVVLPDQFRVPPLLLGDGMCVVHHEFLL